MFDIFFSGHIKKLFLNFSLIIALGKGNPIKTPSLISLSGWSRSLNQARHPLVVATASSWSQNSLVCKLAYVDLHVVLAEYYMT